MNATELAAISFNCLKTNLPPLPLLCRKSANHITYLFLDSLALGSQGVLHFTRTDDHFPKKVCYFMDAAMSFLGALPAS